MKIVIPYAPEELFSDADHHLMSSLGLDPIFLFNRALEDWTLYSYGQAWDKYENTVDCIHEHLYVKYQHNPQLLESSETLLNDRADEVTLMIVQVAGYLHRVLQDIPDDVVRESLNSDVYHVLRVEKLDPIGRYGQLFSQSEPMYA